MQSIIKYKGGYKYQLSETFELSLPLPFQKIEFKQKRDLSLHLLGKPMDILCGSFISISSPGVLHIHNGYSWDGPSGPTIDTKNFMRGALVHDALYQLIRNGKIPKDPWREYADDLLKKMCKEDGMSSLRAWYVWKSVRWFGHGAVEKPREVMTAP